MRLIKAMWAAHASHHGTTPSTKHAAELASDGGDGGAQVLGGMSTCPLRGRRQGWPRERFLRETPGVVCCVCASASARDPEHDCTCTMSESARKPRHCCAPKPEPRSRVSVIMPPTEAISQLYSQSSARGRGLVVSERLWFACVLNGSSLDFFDLAATTPQPDVACAFKFLCSERLTGDAPATEAVLSPQYASTRADAVCAP